VIDFTRRQHSAGSLGAVPTDPAKSVLLERFIAGTAEAMIDLGWEVDPAYEPGDMPIFLGTFVRSFEADDWLATVEFILESGPSSHRVELGLAGLRSTQRFRATVGGEVGIRHLPTERLLRTIDVRCESGISRDLEEVLEGEGSELPTMTDAQSVDEASQILVAFVDAYTMPFARQHADVDAVIEFITDGEQTTRDQEFGYMFVPALLAASGRHAEARTALADFLRRPKPGPADEEEYARFAARLYSWLDSPSALF